MGIKALKPTGGFYILCDFSSIIRKTNKIFSDIDLSKILLQDTGVATLPGSDFGLRKDKMILRLSFVDFDGEKALNYLKIRKKLQTDDYKVLFPMVYQGIINIKNWISKRNILFF